MSLPAYCVVPEVPMISFLGVTKSFGSGRSLTPALAPISLDIERGSFVSLVGPSGSGKTTLLNLIAGLLTPDTGTVVYDGQPVSSANAGIGYMTQIDALLPWRTVISNVALPLEIRKVAKADRLKTAGEIMAQVGLAGFERHFPGQLSGGMRKRAALARTLIYQPKTLLLDEPFSALDSQTRTIIQQQLKDLARKLGLTVLLVTHDIHEAIALSDKVVVFSRRPASIIEVIDMAGYEREVPKVAGGTAYDRIWRLLADQIDFAQTSSKAP